MSRSTVIRITPESVSPEVLAKAENYKQLFIEKARRNVRDGLDEMYRRMFTERAKLAEVTGAVKISHDILQLQSGDPTSITETRIVDTKILDYFNSVSEEADLRGALEIVQEHCVEMLRLRGISVNQGDVDRWVEERRLALAKRVE